MLKTKPAGLLHSPLPLLAAALLLVAVGLLAWLLQPAAPAWAQAQDDDAPAVDNLRCIAETDRVAFLWEAPEWSGGEAASYDYELTLPDGREEQSRLGKGPSPTSLVYKPGSYQPGRETRFKVTTVFRTDGGGDVIGALAELVCYVGGKAETPTPTPTPTPEPTPTPTPNNPPTVASATADATIVNENGTHQVSLSGVFNDADSDSLTVTAGSSNTAVAAASVAADYSSLTVTAKARGTATVTVTADDGNGGTVEDDFTVTVKAAPTVASALADVSGLEVNATQEASLSGVFSDADGDSLTIMAGSSSDAVATATVASDQSKLTLAGVAQGTATITVTAQDSDGNRVSDTFDVSVVPAPQQAPPNRAPAVTSAIADSTIVHESGTRSVSLSGVFNDADNDSLSVTAASSNTAVATASVSSDYATLTVSAKGRGMATITATADDGNGGTVADTFIITVKAAPAVSVALADVSGLEVGGTQEVSLSGAFTDADGDALTITATSSDDAKATATVASDYSRLTLAGVSVGTATVTVTARDSDGSTVSDAFDAPVARKYNALIAQMYEWRNDSQWSSYKSHTDKWDRTLLAFGETVADTTLTPMTAAEAQAFANTPNGQRWVPVAAALWVIEAAARQEPQQQEPQSSDGSLLERCASHLPSNALSVSEVEGWRDEHPSNTAHVLRWNEVLAALAADVPAGVTAMTVAESRANERRWNPARWVRVTATLEALEVCRAAALQAADPPAQDPPVNRAPTVSAAIADATIVHQSGTRQVSLSGVFDDADSDSLTVTAGSSNTAVATASVSSDGSTLTVTAKARGSATITATANDGNGGTVADTFTVTVKAAPAVSVALADVSGLEVGGTREVSLSGVFTDADGDALTVTAGSSNNAVTRVLAALDGSKLTVAAVAEGTATVTVTARDSDGNTVSDAFDVAVAALQQAPQQPQQTPGPGDTVWSALLTAQNKGFFTGCSHRYPSNGTGCPQKLSDNSFTYKGKTYEVTGLYLHSGWSSSPYARSLSMSFQASHDYRSHTRIYMEENLHELALRVGQNDAFLSILDSIPYPTDFTTWKDPGLSWKTEDEDGWTAADRVSVSLEVLTAAPAGVTVAPGDEKLDLSWTAPAVPTGTTITGYEVRYWDGRRHGPVSTGSTDTEYALTGLTNGRHYSVQVRATHSKGHGAWSYPAGKPRNNWHRGTPVGSPYAPTGVTTRSSDRRILVEWQMDRRRNGGAPITGYHVHYTASTGVAADAAAAGSDPAAGWVDAGDAGLDTRHWISGLTNDTYYRVRVRAVNQHGSGDWHAEASGVPLHPAPFFGLQTARITRDGKPGLRLTYRFDPNARPVDVVAHVIDPRRHKKWLLSDEEGTVEHERAPGGAKVVWPERGVDHVLPAGASISCANDPNTPGVGHCEVVGLPRLIYPNQADGAYHARVYARVGEEVSPKPSAFSPQWYDPYGYSMGPLPPGYGLMQRD